MLIPVKDYPKYGLDADDQCLPQQLEAIEHRIRVFTRNRFQVRGARIEAASRGGALQDTSPSFHPGDTVQITCSAVNDGLYVVASVEDGVMKLDHDLADEPCNRVTLVRYPPDVIAGAVGILEYNRAMPKAKAAIASETISRHAVSYRAVSSADGLAGYPQEVTAFLKPYMRACF